MNTDQAGQLDVVAAARALGATLNAGGREARETGHLTPAVVHAIVGSRLLMMFCPARLGGLDVSLIEGLKAIEELSHADAPAGWSMMAVSVMGGNVSSGLSPEGLEALFASADEGGLRVAGQPFRPGSGRARPVPGGYVVSGAAQFASGSMLATHFIFTARVLDGDEPLANASGEPAVIAAVVPRADVELRGNWDVDALEPTESVDYGMTGVFVPEASTYRVDGLTDARRRGKMYRGGSRVVGTAVHGAVALGIARRLLEEIAAVSPARSRGRGSTLADDRLFEHELASSSIELDAIAALFYASVARAEQAADRGLDPDPIGIRVAGVVSVIHEIGMRCADLAYRWAGSSAFRSNSAIGRFFRDMSVARNHLQADRGNIAGSAPVIREELTRTWRALTAQGPDRACSESGRGEG